jgi:hypothetical protein
VLGDLSGDGKTDLVVATFCRVNFQDTCTVAVIVLLGNGRLGYPATAGSSLQSLAVADFNGDGRPDLAELAIGFNNSSLR